MAGDQISGQPAGEPGFTASSVFLRLIFALVVVLLTFNPSGFSFFHWARDAFLASSLGRSRRCGRLCRCAPIRN